MAMSTIAPRPAHGFKGGDAPESERSADAAPAGRLTARRSQNGATRLGRFIGGMRRPNFLVYGLQVTRWKFATEGTSKCQVSTEELDEG